MDQQKKSKALIYVGEIHGEDEIFSVPTFLGKDSLEATKKKKGLWMLIDPTKTEFEEPLTVNPHAGIWCAMRTRLSSQVRNFKGDGDGPSDNDFRKWLSNHRKLRRLRVGVVSVTEKVQHRLHQVGNREMSESEPLQTCRKREW